MRKELFTVDLCMNGLIEGVCVWADNAVCPVLLNHLRRIKIYVYVYILKIANTIIKSK
jgi:hypothetical protein